MITRCKNSLLIIFIRQNGGEHIKKEKTQQQQNRAVDEN